MHVLKWVENIRSFPLSPNDPRETLMKVKPTVLLPNNVGTIPLSMMSKGRFSVHVNT